MAGSFSAEASIEATDHVFVKVIEVDRNGAAALHVETGAQTIDNGHCPGDLTTLSLKVIAFDTTFRGSNLVQGAFHQHLYKPVGVGIGRLGFGRHLAVLRHT